MQQPDTDQYLTMLLADIDFAEGSAIVAQAGHPSPVVQRADGEVQFTSCFGLPIGLIEGAEYTSFRVDFAPGDRFLLYSDGITECPDPDGVLLDESGLAEILRQSKDLKGRKLLSHLVGELESFSGLSEFPDDLSAILVEFRGNSD
jgi:sigma-B regulation protein RsbU (phosphoserine phosphatase)